MTAAEPALDARGPSSRTIFSLTSKGFGARFLSTCCMIAPQIAEHDV
jgi:hypothetical protein